MQHFIFPPVSAVAVMACVAILQPKIPSGLCWSLVAASIGVILVWKLAVRAAARTLVGVEVEQRNLAASKPLAIAYLVFLPLMSLALWAVWYFNLGLISLLIFICVWSIRKEVYGMLLARRDELIDGSNPAS